MPAKVKKCVKNCVVIGLVALVCSTAEANWLESFGGNAFDLTTWTFGCYPDVTKTFSAPIVDGPDDDDYLSLDETASFNLAVGSYGSAFGMGFGSDEVFGDVRVGALVNVTGDASGNFHGLAARAGHFSVPQGSVDPPPGMIASAYVMFIHWEDGPANLRIELLKIFQNDDEIMRTYEPEVPVPGLDHARSHYVELDVVGSDPVYITGSIYEYKGGPLMVRTPTFIDTGRNDPWERPGIHDAVYISGVSGICAINEDAVPAGYHCTFDDVYSISDGPAAVNPSPADGATGVSIYADLSWVEAAFATGRELWFGKQGSMQKVAPAPAGTSFDPGTLEFGQTYEWQVDEIGAAGTVTGPIWTFTTGQCLVVDDFEDYSNSSPKRVFETWLDGVGYSAAPPYFPVAYCGNDTGAVVGHDIWTPDSPYYGGDLMERTIVYDGRQSMPLYYNNSGTTIDSCGGNNPLLYSETERTWTTPQDWTRNQLKTLSLAFRGEDDNVEQPMFIRLEDSAGNTSTVVHPYTYAVQSEFWRSWEIALEEFSNGGVDLATVTKMVIGIGDGTNSGQKKEDVDTIYIDNIRLYPARCFNVEQLDLRGDVNGDCMVNFYDFEIMADGWLNEGLAVVP